MKKRLLFFILFILLVLVEAFIALFVHDNIVRPYIGDVLVVGVVYFFIRFIFPDRKGHLPLYVFLFAVFIEVSQYFNIVKLLNLQDNKLAVILIGTSFSYIDILCYLTGCILLYVFQRVMK